MASIILGFSGTREGMSPEQYRLVIDHIRRIPPISEAHHGMCMGADCEFEEIVRRFSPNTKIVGHPGVNSEGKCPTRGDCNPDVVLPERPFLGRDDDIAKICDHFIATPLQMNEVQRSGTWTSLRRARKYRKTTSTILRNGYEIFT